MFTVKEERTLRGFYGMAALRVGNGPRKPTYRETVAFAQRLGASSLSLPREREFTPQKAEGPTASGGPLVPPG